MDIECFNEISIEKPSIPVCQCCLSDTKLRNAQERFTYNGKFEVFVEMILECFSIELKDEDVHLYICELCISKLRSSLSFRRQIKMVQFNLNECNFLNESDISTDAKREDIRECDDKTTLQKDLSDIFENEQFNSFDNSPEELYIVKEEIIENDIFPKKNKEHTKLDVFETKQYGSCYKESTEKLYIVKNELIPNEILLEKKKEQNELYIFENKQFISCKEGLAEHSYAAKEKIIVNDILPKKKKKREHKKLYQRMRYQKLKPFKLDKSVLSCTICNETFPTHKTLLTHMSVHYPKFICDICGKSTISKTFLQHHMLSHSEKIPCKLCQRMLKPGSMKRHVKLHTEVVLKSYVCPHCPERFKCYFSRSKHLTKFHDLPANKYECKVCLKMFPSSGSLAIHKRNVHLQERNHICNECGRRFFRKKDLDHHEIVHTKERKFQCDVCKKAYGRRDQIILHMKIHLNIKNFKCHVCGRAFTQKCTLQGHMKTHRDVL